MAVLEKEFQTLRLERDQEREANKKLQSFLVGHLKEQTECQGVGDNGLKTVPEMTTQVYVNSDSTTGKPVSSGVNMDAPPVLRKQMVPPEVKTLYATQTQAALRNLTMKPEKTADVQKTSAEGKTRKRSTRKPDQGKKELPKDDSKKDSDSDSSSFEDLVSGTQVRATGQGSIMFNPMVNITALEDFDEKQPLAVRTRWLETFQSLAVMGRCWKRFVKAFREEYCKAKTPDSEYYYATFQPKSETPREFYYRLNKIAGKADIDIKSTYTARDRHLKVFIKKLKDTQLRSTLQGQRVRSLKDLEHIL
ncbi:hypothetical protein PHMEG_00027259, partial [Phytophthora megakarya]